MAALAFLEARIDDAVARGMQSTPTVPGRVKRYTPSGALGQNYVASLPIHRYELSHGVRTAAQYQALLDLFYVVHFTPYMGFRLRDWRDYKLTQANSRLVFVSGSDWQIHRLHTFGGAEFVRPIYKPETGIVVKRTRSGVVSTATATVDTTTGVATISGHVGGDTYTAEGSFDMPVTFTDDEWSAEIIGGEPGGHIVLAGQIKLEEVRL
jgi:uncharacterized protein (TIGR02217 family)